jgi:glucose-6-phosphate isomerase
MKTVDKPEWSKLRKHWEENKDLLLRDLFRQDPDRHARYSIDACGLHLDYSKNLIQDETLDLLEDLLDVVDFERCREAMFSGAKINNTEERAALHIALRSNGEDDLEVEGEKVQALIDVEKRKMKLFCEKVENGTFLGFTGKKIRNIVNIGIGGSDLGPYMVTEALKHYYDPKRPRAFYVSNVDGTNLQDVMENLNLEETLFVIASKSFTTQETMTNANAAKGDVLKHYNGNPEVIASHFVAISTNDTEVVNFGIASENIFRFWDWVGGRYSLWSSIGLSISLNLGYQVFEDLLAGAHSMDQHFLKQPVRQNMPIVMALLGIWYNNFYEWETHAILPYAQHLHKFPGFLQQLDMESNGKRVTSKGDEVSWHTGPIVWGEAGTNGQHAFFPIDPPRYQKDFVRFYSLPKSSAPLRRTSQKITSQLLCPI